MYAVLGFCFYFGVQTLLFFSQVAAQNEQQARHCNPACCSLHETETAESERLRRFFPTVSEPWFTCKQTETHVFRRTRVLLFGPHQSLHELSHLPKQSGLSKETNSGPHQTVLVWKCTKTCYDRLDIPHNDLRLDLDFAQKDLKTVLMYQKNTAVYAVTMK